MPVITDNPLSQEDDEHESAVVDHDRGIYRYVWMSLWGHCSDAAGPHTASQADGDGYSERRGTAAGLRPRRGVYECIHSK